MSTPGFFTRGVTFVLPHPRIPLRLILIVDAVVERGLQLLREDPPINFELASADEDTITFQLHWIIENRLRKSKEVRGFNRQMFGKVWREPKVTNFDGTHPDKMPDLVFDLKRDSLPVLTTHDAVVVECKLVDEKHPPGKEYCDKGLQRFVVGDYAWTMQEAMMVAYVRDGRCIATNLLPAIARRREKLGILQEPAPVRESRGGERADGVHVSVHARTFSWPEGRGRACNIRIFHSWHSCS